jgi:hypothetical protein
MWLPFWTSPVKCKTVFLFWNFTSSQQSRPAGYTTSDRNRPYRQQTFLKEIFLRANALISLLNINTYNAPKVITYIHMHNSVPKKPHTLAKSEPGSSIFNNMSLPLGVNLAPNCELGSRGWTQGLTLAPGGNALSFAHPQVWTHSTRNIDRP